MVSAEKASSAFPLLRIEALEKRFGDQHVLRGIDIDVGAGETVVVIGASGSGKTTLLRCLNHLETPDAGAIWLDGETIGGAFTAPRGAWRPASQGALADQRRHFGFVFQRFNLFPHLTARDNVAIGPEKVRGLAKAEAVRSPNASSPASSLPITWTSARCSFQAASSSGWRLPGRSPWSRA